MLAVIIVTHDSAGVFGECVKALDKQQFTPHQVIIVDSGSTDRSYLEAYRQKQGYALQKRENIGFSAANNVGFDCLDPDVEYVLFINPDTFLLDDCLETAVKRLQEDERVGMLTGMLRGFDRETMRPNGRIDSAGIFRTWYGRWYDRGKGQVDQGQYPRAENVPAVCGAFMLCRKQALDSVIERSGQVFDESFFMYKEDIDLSWRLRKRGWQLRYDPQVVAYHARGWARDRNSVAWETRRMASANEIRLNIKHRSPYLTWALAKYAGVRIFRV